MMSIRKIYHQCRNIAAGTILAGTLIGCGYKTSLRPPEPRRVETVTDLQADLACDGILLNWAPALFDSRGNPLDEPATYLVYRKRGLPFDQKTDKVDKRDKIEAVENVDDTEEDASKSDLDDWAETIDDEFSSGEIETDGFAEDEVDQHEDSEKDDDVDSIDTLKRPEVLPQEYTFSLVAVVPGKPVSLTTTAIAEERVNWSDTGAPSGPAYLPDKIKYRIPSRLPYKTEDVSDGLIAGYVYTYFVVALDAAGVTSAPSAQVECPWVAIPAAPENPGVAVSKNNVTLSWRKPSEDCLGKPLSDITSYEIFRSEASTPELFKHVFTAGGDELEKTDNTVIMDSVYRYKIRAVILKSIPGEFSESVTADTTNVFPPSPPTLLTGGARATGVVLNWRASEDKDIAGYRIYRRSSKQADFKLLNPENPVVGTTYIDETVKKNETYVYRLTSVDNSANANESEPGDAWTVTIH